MLQQEFEKLAMRGNGEINGVLYNSIERFYMSDSEYHNQFGGQNETKQNFVKRVFGGKVNTLKTISKKIADESNKENRWCLQGYDKKRLDEMEILIREHYEALSKMKY